jgi:glycosyltransferase involved in cell wall biosynthesis
MTLAASPKISVVICTYNRADLLRSALETICNQSLPNEFYEVIAVDNNSSDDTKAVVDGFLHHGNVRYLLETKQGLANARNAGWQAADGAFVGFMDDDSKAPYEWLSVAARIIEEGAFKVFGGPIRPFYSCEKPVWYKESYDLRDFGAADAPLVFKGKGYLSGGNIFISRQLLSAVGGFNADLGMIGGKLAYGEETDLQMRLRKMMPDIEMLCDRELYNYHLVRPEKLSLWWDVKEHFTGGRNSPALFYDPMSQESTVALLINLVKTVGEISKSAVVPFLARNKEDYPCWQNYYKEITLKKFNRLGRLYWYIFNRKIDRK